MFVHAFTLQRKNAVNLLAYLRGIKILKLICYVKRFSTHYNKNLISFKFYRIKIQVFKKLNWQFSLGKKNIMIFYENCHLHKLQL